MTRPVTPRFASPVTELSPAIRLDGLVPGAVVKVWKSQVLVATTTAKSPDEWIAVGNPSLLQGATLKASQQSGAEVSDPMSTKDQWQCWPLPSSLGAVQLWSVPWECGLCLYFDGAYPGASIELRSERFGVSSPRSPAAVAYDTHPRLPLKGRLVLGEQLTIQQHANVSSPITYLPPVVFLPKGPLPPLSFPVPPVACTTSIAIDGALEGAHVELQRFVGGTEIKPALATCFDLPSADWPLPSPVVLNQVFRATQRMCDRLESPVVEISAGPAVLAPPIIGPACAEDGRVTVHNLVPGALVTFHSVNPIAKSLTPYRVAGAYAETCTFYFSLEGILALAADQQLECGGQPVHSPIGPTQVLGPAPDGGPLALMAPITECARVVRVSGGPPGAELRILRTAKGGTQKQRVEDLQNPPTCNAQLQDVPLSYPPDAGDTLQAVAYSCGTLLKSNEVQVVSLRKDAALVPPTLDPPKDCAPIVVRNALPGALLWLFSDGLPPVEKKLAGASTVVFPRPKGATRVHVTQQICGLNAQTPEYPIAQGSLQRLSSLRVCQLTGSKDIDDSTLPHPNDTTTLYFDVGGTLKKFIGTDLGIPVERNGELILFFGDSVDAQKPIARVRKDTGCLTLDFVRTATLGPNGERIIAPLRVAGRNDKGLRFFEVPTGAFEYEGRIYLFIMRNETESEDAEEETEGQVGNLEGQHAYLLRAVDLSEPFDQLYYIDRNTPERLPLLVNVAPVVVSNADWPGLPQSSGKGVLLFGSRAYRQSDVFLAWMPLTPGKAPPPVSEWYFLTQVTPGPTFEKYAGNTPMNAGARALGLFASSDALTGPLPQYLVGELGVTWVPAIGMWLMTYDTPGGARLRYARTPWGPWLPNGPYGAFAPDHGLSLLNGKELGGPPIETSGPYGHYMNPAWTSAVEGGVRLRWLISFLDSDHGQVHMMESMLSCS